QSASTPRATVEDKLLTVEYDAFGAMTAVRRFSDLARRTPVATTSFEYECAGCFGRLSAIRHRRASDGAVIHDLVYGRDLLGDVLSLLDAEGLHTYAYDGLRRLLQATHPPGGPQPDEQYAYDLNGNRASSHLSGAYTYGYELGTGGNELVQDYTYDYQ